MGLWFAGDVSFAEIATLKKEDANKGILRKYKRARFITRALKLHSQRGDYVFMVINDGQWEKFTPQGFMMKLYHICNKLGIKYKKINRNEAMLCKE